MKKKKVEVLFRLSRFPVIGNEACAADYSTGCVLEKNSSTSFAINRYTYDEFGNVVSKEVMRISDDDFLDMSVNLSISKLLKKIRENVGCSFAIRKDVAEMLS